MGLKKVNIKDWRDLAPLEGWARVVKVYDGDTFWLALSPGEPTNLALLDLKQPELLRLVNVRLARVNAPEMKGAESAKGKLSKAHVESLIADQIVWFKFGNFGLYHGESLDCFHRQIGEIYFRSTLPKVEYFGGQAMSNLSDHLLESGFAVPFVPK
jgi:endonuclease YncB( thermonuclease family)